MPKTHKRRKASDKGSSGQSRASNAQVSASSTHRVSTTPVSNTNANGTRTTQANRPFFSPRIAGPQSLILPAMVALGCWLMAYTLIFLTTEENRYTIGGLAVLMALLWTFSFGMRVRKLLIQQRSR